MPRNQSGIMQRKYFIPLACLAAVAAVFFLLRFASGSRTEVASAADAAGSSEILPYGKNLDFSLLKKYNPDGKLFDYPAVNPGEVGVTVESLIKK